MNQLKFGAACLQGFGTMRQGVVRGCRGVSFTMLMVESVRGFVGSCMQAMPEELVPDGMKDNRRLLAVKACLCHGCFAICGHVLFKNLLGTTMFSTTGPSKFKQPMALLARRHICRVTRLA